MHLAFKILLVNRICSVLPADYKSRDLSLENLMENVAYHHGRICTVGAYWQSVPCVRVLGQRRIPQLTFSVSGNVWRHSDTFRWKLDVCATVHHVWIDKRYQLDAAIMIYYQKLSLHVSRIYMPIFRSTGCMLLHMVFSTRCCGCGSKGPVRGLVHCV